MKLKLLLACTVPTFYLTNNYTRGAILRFQRTQNDRGFYIGRIDYSESEVSDGHLSVVVGIDKENIYLQDPEIGKLRTISRDDFMKVWWC